MRDHPRRGERGYAMAALLVTLAAMSVVLGMAMPVWRTVVQREKEEELVFRGRQYARAIQLYQRKYAAAYPASLDLLVEQKFLRKKYKDPITNGEFEILYQGTLAQRQAASAAAGRGTGRRHAGRRRPRRGPRADGRWPRTDRGRTWRLAVRLAGGRLAGRHRRRGEQEQGEVDPGVRRPHDLQRVAVRVDARAGDAHRPGWIGRARRSRWPARLAAAWGASWARRRGLGDAAARLITPRRLRPACAPAQSSSSASWKALRTACMGSFGPATGWIRLASSTA